MEQRSNKTNVLEFYKQVVGMRKSELINTYVREDYIQHSAMGKDGRASLVEMIEFLKTLPKPETTKSPILRAVEDDDLVAVQLDIVFMGKRMVVIDIFRLEGGQLAEHWDVIQEQAEQTDSLITSTNGTTEIDTTADSLIGKSIISGFYHNVMENKPATKLLADTYIEHDPAIINSGKALDGYLRALSGLSIKIHKILAEGDFVVVQAEFIYPDKVDAHYDIFRIDNEQIAEHWSVEQAVPVVMPHNNGMF